MPQTSPTPQEIVTILDGYIIGQADAKKAMAVSLRNRWRRFQVRADLQQEIMPKNIMMIGPTGVGKTEISRRLAKIIEAPFIKVEATKFTQIGYVGKDVESIIRDLTQSAYQKCHAQAMVKTQIIAKKLAEEELLKLLLPAKPSQTLSAEEEKPEDNSRTKEKLRQQLRNGELDDKEVEIEKSIKQPTNIQIMGGPNNLDEIGDQFQEIMKQLNPKPKKRKTSIKEALNLLQIHHAHQIVDDEAVKKETVTQVEQGGIVFLDEIDKIAKSGGEVKGDVSREGVQRDLLPLIEGTCVQTKYGAVNTDHILFIASGAFHQSKPSDLIAELQGRLPIRVELSSLTVNDFERILTEPKHSLLKQYSALLEADGVILKWQKSAIKEIAEISYQVNEKNENIGARRLHTILENLLAEISFEAPNVESSTIIITAKLVKERLQHLADDKDLSQFIL